MPREKIPELYADFVQYEKKHGDRAAIEVHFCCGLVGRLMRLVSVFRMPRSTIHTLTLTLPESTTIHDKQTNKLKDVVVGKRRAQYEEALSADPLDYDTWFDYARLEEAQVCLVGWSMEREDALGVCTWCTYDDSIPPTHAPPPLSLHIPTKPSNQQPTPTHINISITQPLEPQGELARIREVYERAIAQVPPVREKRCVRCAVLYVLLSSARDTIDFG